MKKQFIVTWGIVFLGVYSIQANPVLGEEFETSRKPFVKAILHDNVGEVKDALKNLDQIFKDKTDKSGLLSKVLILAAYGSGNPALLKELVDAGADIEARDEDGVTALSNAASMEHNQALEYLLSKGAPVNQIDRKGRTPLYMAAVVGNIDGVKLLLAKGADKSLEDTDGKTAVMIAEESLQSPDISPAAKKTYPEIIKLLQ